MELVIIESPYAGRDDTETEVNVEYARACVRDCLNRDESPYASHLLLTQPGVLDDRIPAERTRGIEAGFAFRMVVQKTKVYVDRGLSTGMMLGIKLARSLNHEIQFRSLYGNEALVRKTFAMSVEGLPAQETWTDRAVPFTLPQDPQA